jgi:hypothetical protein
MNDVWYRNCIVAIATFGVFCIGASSALAQSSAGEALSAAVARPTDDTGLRLPAGFCASLFADGIGHARHLVVAPNGVVYGALYAEINDKIVRYALTPAAIVPSGASAPIVTGLYFTSPSA